ncbi:hypothetical protein NA57DRAFT_72445 [Rhizodiscina lignyota]|uniref:Uncharacterized protein n=1 Tax=Rhizodiscina lignyota TaxID=1504668 RepID=A0A9P4IQF5_9PEZI|nr:hypothetical protein NA57DRAFT_72445 [Rhizodiscina lignyota]
MDANTMDTRVSTIADIVHEILHGSANRSALPHHVHSASLDTQNTQPKTPELTRPLSLSSVPRLSATPPSPLPGLGATPRRLHVTNPDPPSSGNNADDFWKAPPGIGKNTTSSTPTTATTANSPAPSPAMSREILEVRRLRDEMEAAAEHARSERLAAVEFRLRCLESEKDDLERRLGDVKHEIAKAELERSAVGGGRMGGRPRLRFM